jgi:hypothetical protein
MIANILSSFTIITRAYLFFNDQTAYVIALDMLSLLLFSFLIIYKKEYLYSGVLAFLPSVSIYLMIVNKPISDLSFVCFLMTFSIIIHKRSIKSLPNKEPLTLFVVLYLSLAVLLLFTNLYNLVVPSETDDTFLKYLDFLFLTAYASFAFLMIYEEKEAVALADALLIAVISYIAASLMGYLFFDYQNIDIIEYEAGGFDFLKNLMRYPGLSNSNYIGHIILLMIVIAYSITPRRLYLYTLLVLFASIVTQSRTVFYTGVIFLLYCAFQEMKHRASKLKVIRNMLGMLVIVMGSLFLLIYLNEDLQNIVSQFKDRVTMESGLENVAARLDIVRSTVETISGNYKKLFFGIGYIPDDANPHNFILQSILLFGLVPSVFIIFYYAYLVKRMPIVIVIMIASFGEILFYTSSYDFLFFILILVNMYKTTRQMDHNLMSIC